MSTQIDFNRMAFKVEDSDTTQYLLCVKTGSNNMLNTDGTISNRWGVQFYGSREEIMNHLDVFETSIEGGALRWSNGDVKSLKHYKARYKQTLESAEPIEKFKDYFPTATEYIYIKKDTDGYEKALELILEQIDHDEGWVIADDWRTSPSNKVKQFEKCFEDRQDVENYYNRNISEIIEKNTDVSVWDWGHNIDLKR